jgi:hypothetical protein
MAATKGRRGAAPTALEEAYAAPQSPSKALPPPLQRALLYHAPLALQFAYLPTMEVQRLLRLRGYALVVAEDFSSKSRPAFFVAAHVAEKRAVLVVRGTHSALDWLTNR